VTNHPSGISGFGAQRIVGSNMNVGSHLHDDGTSQAKSRYHASLHKRENKE